MARQRVVGVDVGATGVRAAQVALGAQPILEKYGQVALPPGAVRDGEVVDPAVVVQALRQLWAAVRFSGKDIVLGVANQRVVVRQVDLLWMPQKELRKSLPMLVQDYVPLPVDQAILDFVPVAEITGEDGARMLRGLLVAAVDEMVSTLVDAASQASLRPRVVDLVPFALVRALASTHIPGSSVRPEAIVDVGARVTNIVVHEGGLPRFVRILVLGGDMITDALAGSRGIDVADAEALKRRIGVLGQDSADEDVRAVARSVAGAASTLVDEIRGSLDYYLATAASQPLARVHLTGGASQLPGFRELLASALRVPVDFSSGLSALRIGETGLTDEQLAIVAPNATVAVGLALGGSA